MTATVSAGHSAAESILMEGAFPMVDGSAAESPVETRVCNRTGCTEVISADRLSRTIYCSKRCRDYMAQAAYQQRDPEKIREMASKRERRKKNHYYPACGYCEEEFWSLYRNVQFCSRSCASKAKRSPFLSRDIAPTTRPHVARPIPPLMFTYAIVCIMCGRRQCDDVRLTRKQAASPMRLPRCFACRGNVFLEDVDTGAIGSPRLGRNTIYQPVTALHMGITVR